MRGLLLISMLLALGVVGYMTVTPGPDGESQVDKARQAEKRVDAVRDEMREWAGDFRDIQPEYHRQLPDDQSELGEIEA